MPNFRPTKDLLMFYTFLAMCLPASVAVWLHGLHALAVILVSVGVAVLAHTISISSVRKEEIRHPFSAMVTGMIVALSYSFTVTATTPAITSQILDDSIIVAITAWLAEIIKKRQVFMNRKYLNPVAAAKLLILTVIPLRGIAQYTLPLINIRTSWEFFFFPNEHDIYPLANQADFLKGMMLHYGENPIQTLILLKSHGWIGATSSIAVLVSALVLIILFRRYVKWRIPLMYLSLMTVFSASYWLVMGEGKYFPIELRVAFHVFTGSVLFLAFYMATDPPTTPLTHFGQYLFAIGLGILTFVFQLGINFFGGSILALAIMNLLVPSLDRGGTRKVKKPTPDRIKLADRT